MKDITYYLTLGRRYLLISILCWIMAAYIGLNIKIYNLSESIGRIMIYSAFFIAGCLILVCVFSFILRKNRRAARLLVYGILIVCVAVFGFVSTLYRRASYDSVQKLLEKQKVLYCRVISQPESSSTEKSVSFIADVYKAAVDEKITDFSEPCRIIIYSNNSNGAYIPNEGDFIIVTRPSSMSKNSRATTKGGFDYNRYLRQSDIVYTCYSRTTKQSTAAEVKDDGFSFLYKAGSEVRRRIMESADAYLYGQDEKGLLIGILTGDRSEISNEGYARLSKSGFMHIAAVSGMHISYLLLFITAILSMFHLPKRLAAIITIPCLVIFAAAAQFTPSVCRAVFMMSVFLLSGILRRSSDSLTAIGMAALTLIISNPYYLDNASFLLSFGATVGILVFYGPLRKVIPMLGKNREEENENPPEVRSGLAKRLFYKAVNFLSGSVCLSISASLGTIYFMAKIFGSFQWGSIIGNIAVVPLTGVIFIFGAANALISAVCAPLAYFVGGAVLNPALRIMIMLIKFFSASIFNIWLPSPQPSFFAVYLIICIGIYAMLIQPRRSRRTFE